jgi:hypothetical protein
VLEPLPDRWDAKERGIKRIESLNPLWGNDINNLKPSTRLEVSTTPIAASLACL